MTYYYAPSSKTQESRHNAVGAWFFGPRAENFPYLEKIFHEILAKHKQTRETLFPNDQAFITTEMQQSQLFKGQIDNLEFELRCILTMLDSHSVPFWSPRYNAHMSMETSMPSVIGYLAGLLHNQNNVATEASPFTTMLENDVGRDLCEMFGYDVNPKNVACSWGHITSGGSVANLESIWAARNLKFYPLSLFLTIERGPLKFLDHPVGSAPRFAIELCTGEKKAFMDCTTWELLNLKPSTVLDIPQMLYQTYGISQSALAAMMKKFVIQTKGKDTLERKFHIRNPAKFYVGTTKHYSWPKGAAIAGIGSKHIINVPVDLRARMDPEALRDMLEKAVSKQQAIYAVVAIIGSTEQGAVDPLRKILELRDEFQKKGLSFVVHCDGAWGGYFAAMLRDQSPVGVDKGVRGFVPTLALSEYTIEQLRAYKDADSITIDPHKSGYCPYPAGGLCYRDGRMRYLVTWTSPVVYREGEAVESIGVYGVEGSKPGAAAVGVYLSHRVLGLHKEGYGTLLGEAVFSCARLYCHWAAMKTEPILSSNGTKARLIVRPLNMLPTEARNDPPEEIEKERDFIRERILYQDNAKLIADEKAIELLKLLGGDLMINAFACNFEVDGKVNTDVHEANYLNARIFQELSISDLKKHVSEVPLLLTSTQLAQTQYKECLTHFKNRLGLEGDQDLYVLINVTMSPWPTDGDFLGKLADKFKVVAEKQMEATVSRNVEGPDFHGFVVQGVENVCGVHLPMFNMENHRTQLIISCDFPPDIMGKYRQRKKATPTQFFTFGNKRPAKLLDLIKDGASFEATIQEGLPDDKKPISDSFTVSNVKVLLQRSMRQKDLAPSYPEQMVFYAYSRGSELHMDHLLNVSPSIQLNSERIKLVESSSHTDKSVEDCLAEGVWLRLIEVHEPALQPLTVKEKEYRTKFSHPGLDFSPGAKFAFEGFESETTAFATEWPFPIITGVLELGPSVFAESSMLNEDPAKNYHKHPTTTVMNAKVNGGALAAEYPNTGACEEFRNQHQGSIIQDFRDEWALLKKAEAQKILDCGKDDLSHTKAWLEACVNEGDKAAERRAAPKPIHLYHTGLGQ